MFSMIQHHKYSITELENLIPFERDIYVQMIMNHLAEMEEKQKNG